MTVKGVRSYQAVEVRQVLLPMWSSAPLARSVPLQVRNAPSQKDLLDLELRHHWNSLLRTWRLRKRCLSGPAFVIHRQRTAVPVALSPG